MLTDGDVSEHFFIERKNRPSLTLPVRDEKRPFPTLPVREEKRPFPTLPVREGS